MFRRTKVCTGLMLAFGGSLALGSLPALAQLRDEGGGKLHTVTSCFPSVTGPAYAPFLMGRFPGPIGLPGNTTGS